MMRWFFDDFNICSEESWKNIEESKKRRKNMRTHEKSSRSLKNHEKSSKINEKSWKIIKKSWKIINFHCKKTSNLENFNPHIGCLIFVDQKWTKNHEKSRIFNKKIRCFLSVLVVSLVENGFYFFDFGTGSFGNTVVSLVEKLVKNEAILFPRLACCCCCWLAC